MGQDEKFVCLLLLLLQRAPVWEPWDAVWLLCEKVLSFEAARRHDVQPPFEKRLDGRVDGDAP